MVAFYALSWKCNNSTEFEFPTLTHLPSPELVGYFLQIIGITYWFVSYLHNNFSNLTCDISGWPIRLTNLKLTCILNFHPTARDFKEWMHHWPSYQRCLQGSCLMRSSESWNILQKLGKQANYLFLVCFVLGHKNHIIVCVIFLYKKRGSALGTKRIFFLPRCWFSTVLPIRGSACANC